MHFTLIRFVFIQLDPSISVRRWVFCPVDTSDLQGPPFNTRGCEVCKTTHTVSFQSKAGFPVWV